jgi:hypothetical protein
MNDSLFVPPVPVPDEGTKPHESKKKHGTVQSLLVGAFGGFLLGVVLVIVLRMVGRPLIDGSPAISALSAAIVAWFTIKLTDATERLWKTGEKQAGIIREQLDTLKAQGDQMKRQFVAHYRPQLHIRELALHYLSAGKLSEDRTGPLTGVIVNRGGSCATVVDSRVSHQERQPDEMLSAPLDFGDIRLVDAGTMIPAGGRHDVTITAPDLVIRFRDAYRRPAYDGKVAFLVGYVVFKDDNGIQRRSGFCRIYNTGFYRFEVGSGDPDYEYSD